MWALTKLSGKLPLKNLYHREKHEWWVDRVEQGRAGQTKRMATIKSESEISCDLNIYQSSPTRLFLSQQKLT